MCAKKQWTGKSLQSSFRPCKTIAVCNRATLHFTSLHYQNCFEEKSVQDLSSGNSFFMVHDNFRGFSLSDFKSSYHAFHN